MSSKELVKVSSGYYAKFYFNTIKEACKFVTALEEGRVRSVDNGHGEKVVLTTEAWQIERVHVREPVWEGLGYDVQKHYDCTFSTWLKAGCPLEAPAEEDEAVAA